MTSTFGGSGTYNEISASFPVSTSSIWVEFNREQSFKLNRTYCFDHSRQCPHLVCTLGKTYVSQSTIFSQGQTSLTEEEYLVALLICLRQPVIRLQNNILEVPWDLRSVIHRRGNGTDNGKAKSRLLSIFCRRYFQDILFWYGTCVPMPQL